MKVIGHFKWERLYPGTVDLYLGVHAIWEVAGYTHFLLDGQGPYEIHSVFHTIYQNQVTLAVRTKDPLPQTFETFEGTYVN